MIKGADIAKISSLPFLYFNSLRYATFILIIAQQNFSFLNKSYYFYMCFVIKSLIVVLKKLKINLKIHTMISFFVLLFKFNCFLLAKDLTEITGVELQLECHVFQRYRFKTNSHATVPEIVQFKIEFAINTSVLISIGTSSTLFKFLFFIILKISKF